MSYFCKLKGKLSPLLAQAGLSLLETAVGLVVVGLIVVPVMRMYQQQLAEKAYETNLGNLNETLDAINQFFVSGNGAYPCPTDLSLAQGDGDFGQSADCSVANFANIKLCTDPTWFATGGVCKTDIAAPNALIIGGVPFSDLKMTSEEVLDFWGNKIIYAVSYPQTDVSSYVHQGGIVEILTLDDPRLVAIGPATNPNRDGVPDLWGEDQDLILISTGRDGVGGYSSKGIRLTACTNTVTRQDENCDFDGEFFAWKGPEDTDFSAYSEGNNNAYFDDMTVLQRSPPVGTWFQHSKNPLYVNNDFVLTGATKITVNSTDNNPADPYPEVNLEVEGDITAERVGGPDGGHLRSNTYCSTTSLSDCLDPQYITDAMDSMNCVQAGPFSSEINRAVRRISGSAGTSSVGCSTGTNTGGTGGVPLQVDSSQFNDVDCEASGMVATGINTAGEIQCAAIP